VVAKQRASSFSLWFWRWWRLFLQNISKFLQDYEASHPRV
jgi:hypothetical protein